MPQILQARLQQYVNQELQDVQVGFRKGRGTRNQIAHIRWIIEKAREFQKNIYFCLIDNKLWKILRDENTRPPYPSSEKTVCRSRATVRTGHGTTDWLKIGKGVRQGYILAACLFKLHAEYII